MKTWYDFIRDIIDNGGSLNCSPYYKDETWVWVSINPSGTNRVFCGAQESFEENIMSLQIQYLKFKHSEFMNRNK